MEKMNGQFGNGYAVKGNMTPEMKSKGNMKNDIPKAMTNKAGADKEFDGGKSNGVCYTHDRKCNQD